MAWWVGGAVRDVYTTARRTWTVEEGDWGVPRPHVGGGVFVRLTLCEFVVALRVCQPPVAIFRDSLEISDVKNAVRTGHG